MNNPFEEVPPHSAEMERACLGSMLIHPLASELCISELNEYDFYVHKHQKLFKYLKQIFLRTGSLDEMLVVSVLERNRAIEIVGGRDFIGSLIMETPTAANVEAYILEVKTRSAERLALQRAAGLIENVRAGLIEPESSGTTTGSVALMSERQEAIRKGDYYFVPFEWPILTKYSRALDPGTLTTLCGTGGSAKSFLVIQFLLWAYANHKCALLGIEDGAVIIMDKMLAQLSNEPRVVETEWRGTEEGNRIYEELKTTFAAVLDGVGKCIHQKHRDEHPTLNYGLEWIRKRCDDGCRVMIIDPVSFLDGGDKEWQQKGFVLQCVGLMERYSASLILVTHPRKPQPGKPIMMDAGSIAGAKAFFDHARCVLWYAGMREATEYDCNTETAEVPVQTKKVNKTITILKANRAKGQFKKIGYLFSGGNFRIEEQGIIE